MYPFPPDTAGITGPLGAGRTLAKTRGEDTELGQLYRRALEQVRCEFPEHVWQAFWLTAVDDRLPSAPVDELNMTVNHIGQAKSCVLRGLERG